MNALFQAMNTGTGRTHNGAVTNTTSFDECMDLFGIIGSSRGKDLRVQFDRALAANEDLALRMLVWVRDCRGGAGERRMFRDLLTHMAKKPEYQEQALRVVQKIPEVGYWKDVGILFDQVPLFRDTIIGMVALALSNGDRLCAKYMDRDVKKPKGREMTEAEGRRRRNFRAFRNAFGLSSQQYRKLLSSMTDTVEQKMCAKKWDEIEFGKIPSLAASRYQNAFKKNAPASYGAYLAKLEKGEEKINASVLFPYDVMKASRNGVKAAYEAQWKALPNYMEGTDERILPLIDVSGSMMCGTGVPGLMCMDVAISLGTYLSERNEGIFKDHYMTFQDHPRMEKLYGTDLISRFDQVRGADWGGSTNIQNAFNTLLTKARQFNVPADQMPTMIVILSDMEFNSSWVRGNSVSAFRMIEEEYKKHGYERPKLVFWNLNGRVGNNPVTIGDGGTCMVSGFTPSVMTSVLGAKDFNPYSVMLETLMKPRYAV